MTAKKLIALFFCCITTAAFSGSGCEDCVEWTKVLTLSGGPAWSETGDTQTIYSIPTGFANRYIEDKETRTIGTAELFFGVQKGFAPGILYQLGIAGGGSSETKFEGPIHVNGAATGSDFVYRINQGRVLARGKLLVDPQVFFIQPYITAAIGVAFNRSYGFKTIPPVNPAISPQFYKKNSTVAFTYSGGAGLEVALNRSWHAGVGYEFTDWGKSELGQAISSTFTHLGPELRHIYAHRVLFSISYLC